MANEKLTEARENCREALNIARELQTQLGIPEAELRKLPATFNLFRSVERINALTGELETVAADCREKLAAMAAAKAEAERRAAHAATPEGMLETLAHAAEIKAARENCERTLANLQKRQRMAGLTVSPSRSFKGLGLDALKALEGEMLAQLRAIAPKPEPKLEPAPATLLVLPKVELPVIDVVAELRKKLVADYRRGLEELRRLDASAANALFHPEPSRISEKNLGKLIGHIAAEIVAIQLEAEEAKAEAAAKAEAERLEAEARVAEAERQRNLSISRIQHERGQALRSEYDAQRRSGRTALPFGVWVKERPAPRPMRRAS